MAYMNVRLNTEARAIHISQAALAARSAASAAESEAAIAIMRDEAQAAADAAETAASNLGNTLRDSANLYVHLATGIAEQGQPEPAHTYNTDGSIGTTLTKWVGIGLSGPYTAGNYLAEVRGHVDANWQLRDRMFFYNTGLPGAGTLGSVAGTGGARVRSHAYTAPSTKYHTLNAEWIGASNPTPAQIAELLAGLVIRPASTETFDESPGKQVRQAAFGNGDNLDGDVIAQWVDSYLYVRVRRGWNATTDRIQRYLIGHSGSFSAIGDASQGNGVIDFVGERTVPSSWPRATSLDALWSSANGAVELRTGGDECAPLRLGGNLMYIGGGHGFVCRLATVTGEPITYGHIGRRYTDGAGLEYVVAWVNPAAGQMKLFPKPTGTAATGWTHSNGVIAGGTLTPVGGGAVLTVTGDASSQAWPIAMGYGYSAKFDDGRSIAKGGPLRSGREVILSENYGFGNFRQLYDDLTALSGTFAANPDFGAIATLKQVEMDAAWIIDHTGLQRRPNAPLFLQDILATVIGAQTIKPSLTNGATSLIALVAGTGILNALDFETGADLTANNSEQSFVETSWADATKPPATFGLLARLGAATRHGVVTALSRTVAGGIPATREIRLGTGQAGFYSSSEKSYINAATARAIAANTVVDTLAIAGAVNPADFGDADLSFAWREGGKLRIRAYRAAAKAAGVLPVPSRYLHCPVALVSTTGGAALLSGMVGKTGVRVTWGVRSEIEIEIG